MNVRSQSFVDSLTVAARENPAAAILIGGGALCLFLGRTGVRSLAAATSGALRGVRVSTSAQAGSDAIARASAAGGSAASSLAGNLHDGAGRVGDALANGFDRAATAVRSSPSLVPDHVIPEDILPDVSKLYRDAQSALTELFERQPLALGVVGLAIGAAVASAFQVTQTEKEILGESSGKVTDAMRDRMQDLTHTAQYAAQNLGSDTATALSAAGAKVRDLANQAANIVGSTRVGEEPGPSTSNR